ncbi:hypothetical protein [Lachnoclostridium sp. An181]|uniref:hypothetical protein n=1 Tax=Lachnoclostridium sp. An181 TaxID=1965575 RepID=UPI000B383081|nr:hypothetical protein [Lachnoclostridium sp. An181]OUP48660.1 hypothetical protein B5F18_11285 [Lachnoclostridium sp. An181]
MKMLQHLHVIEAAVPHLSRAVSAVFYLKVYFLMFVGTFYGCLGIKFQFPFLAVMRREVDEPRVIFYGQMNCPAVSGVGAELATGTDIFPAQQIGTPSLPMVKSSLYSILIPHFAFKLMKGWICFFGSKGNKAWHPEQKIAPSRKN